MIEKRIEADSYLGATPTYEDTLRIPIIECGEALIAINEFPDSFLCCSSTKKSGQHIFVREGVLKRLLAASDELKKSLPGARFALRAGWRHIDVQKEYFEKKYQEIAELNPSLDGHSLIIETNKFIASVEIAGHPAGAAVDISIEKDGQPIDMGTEIGDFSAPEHVAFYYEGISADVVKNRTLLRSVLLKQGFAPFNGEWWHFSFGDREWAAYYGHENAIYGPIDLEKSDKLNPKK